MRITPSKKIKGASLMTTTRQWLLNGHPRGRGIAEDDFKLVETELK